MQIRNIFTCSRADNGRWFCADCNDHSHGHWMTLCALFSCRVFWLYISISVCFFHSVVCSLDAVYKFCHHLFYHHHHYHGLLFQLKKSGGRIIKLYPLLVCLSRSQTDKRCGSVALFCFVSSLLIYHKQCICTCIASMYQYLFLQHGWDYILFAAFAMYLGLHMFHCRIMLLIRKREKISHCICVWACSVYPELLEKTMVPCPAEAEIVVKERRIFPFLTTAQLAIMRDNCGTLSWGTSSLMVTTYAPFVVVRHK